MNTCGKEKELNYLKIKEDASKALNIMRALFEFAVASSVGFSIVIFIVVPLGALFFADTNPSEVLLFKSQMGLTNYAYLNSFKLFGFEIWTVNTVIWLSIILAIYTTYGVTKYYINQYKKNKELFKQEMKIIMIGLIMIGLSYEVLFYFYPPNPAAAMLPKTVMTLITMSLILYMIKEKFCKTYMVDKINK